MLQDGETKKGVLPPLSPEERQRIIEEMLKRETEEREIKLKKLARKCLKEIPEASIIINEYAPVASELESKIDKNEEITPEEIEHSRVFVRSLIKFEVLKDDNFRAFQHDPLLVKFIHHDLDNMSTRVSGMLLLAIKNDWIDPKNRDEMATELNTLCRNWPRFSLIYEDIMLRKIDGYKIDKEFQREINLEELISLLADFCKSGALLGQVAKKTRLELQPGIKLNEDERIVNNPGVILNSLQNIDRNAADPEIDAELVKLVIFRTNDELVIQVVDNGIGMRRSTYLDPNHKDFIFGFGRSHRLSSGYGLTNMPERLASMNIALSVKSFSRDQAENGENSFYSNDEKSRPEKVEYFAEFSRPEDKFYFDKKTKEQKEFKPVTIFEIRLPIIKAE